jgi:hypothetical protein
VIASKTVLSQSARPRRILFQLFRDLALVEPAVSLSNAFRNSRLRFRLSSFFFRVRLNLALSPFLFDIYSPSRASHALVRIAAKVARSLPL